VAILGCGTIAQSAHLPAYAKYGVGVTGVWSRSTTTTASVLERFPFVGRVYSSADELLADPDVRIVDIATPPAVRMQWIEAAAAAGKHVLAQKPLTLSVRELDRVPALLDTTAAMGVRIAVNHNARWAPVWRAVTLLVRSGAVGEVVGVTHLHDKPLPPLVGTPFDDVEHMLLTDYLVHWADISRCWLADGATAGGGEIVTVQATDSRVPGQPPEARNPWAAGAVLSARNGATALLRVVGDVVASAPGCPFWVHGTQGTLRGSVLLDSDHLVLDDGHATREVPVVGAWFVDGFAGAMAELMNAVEEEREPEHSVADAALTARLVLAARSSAEAGGDAVRLAGSRPRP
jgi:predicted dehydrogenase